MPIALKRRQDTRANWESNDPVVIDRQLAFTEGAGEFGTPLFKIGDGATAWSGLPYINRKNNLTATSDPTTANDDSQNYSVGSLWSNVNNPNSPRVFICTDTTSGATWVQINVGSNETLAQVLANGNTTGGTDIEITSGDAVNFLNNTFEFSVFPTTLNADRTETKPNADIDWTAAAPEDGFVMKYDHGTATWSAESEGSVVTQDLGETLYNGNTTDGEDIVFSNGDVADFTNASGSTNLITFPSSGYLRHFLAGALEWRLSGDINFTNSSGYSAFNLDNNGNSSFGDSDLDSTLTLYHDGFGFTVDPNSLTAARTETLPDGDIDWTGGSDGYVMTQQADGSWQPEVASGGGLNTPSTSTDNAIVRWSGTGADTVEDSGVTIDDSDNLSGVNNVTGVDTDFVTGTAGTDGNLAEWNADGDAVDSGVASADVITEADVTGTARQYTKGQGGTLVTLTSATNATPIDFADGNFFTYTAVENSTLAAPTNDQPFSCVIFFEQDGTGGRTFAFNAAYDVFGDDIPIVAGDKALIQITSDGAGELVVIIQARQ